MDDGWFRRRLNEGEGPRGIGKHDFYRRLPFGGFRPRPANAKPGDTITYKGKCSGGKAADGIGGLQFYAKSPTGSDSSVMCGPGLYPAAIQNTKASTIVLGACSTKGLAQYIANNSSVQNIIGTSTNMTQNAALQPNELLQPGNE